MKRSNRVPAIVGIAESNPREVGVSALDIQVSAALEALADCGMSPKDVDGIATNDIVGKFDPSIVAEKLGIQPTWMDGTNIGGPSTFLFLDHATRAIQSGAAEVVLICYGSDQKSSGRRTLSSAEAGLVPLAQYEAPYAPPLPISAYALAAQRYMYEYGVSSEQLGEVAIAAREWARLNPRAYRSGADSLTTEEILQSPMISSPLRRLDCCLVTDGGGAIVVTSASRARDLPKAPIHVLGTGYVGTHRGISQMRDLTSTGAALATSQALTGTGLTLSDMDVVEIYDSFTITVLLTLESMGFCGPGEAPHFIADRGIGPGGSFPLNTNGGGLSHCHPGQYGIFLLTEAVAQLRGEAGARQLNSPQTAICHATGGYLSTHATAILGV